MNDYFELSNKLVLVTGASSGIGREIAVTLSKAEASLIITGRDEPRLKETLSLLKGDNHRMIRCDLTSEAELEYLVSQLPKLNGVVHTAGVFDMKPVKFVDKTDIESINSINYQTPVLLTQLLLFNKLFTQQASIVFITSISSFLGTVGFGLYAASKGALTSFARVLALETAAQQIRVNCIAPGMVKTPMFDQTSEALSEEVMNDNEKLYPLGFVSPLDVALGVQFLLSDASMKITGTTLVIDGGYSIA